MNLPPCILTHTTLSLFMKCILLLLGMVFHLYIMGTSIDIVLAHKLGQCLFNFAFFRGQTGALDGSLQFLHAPGSGAFPIEA